MKKIRIIQILFLAVGLLCYLSCKDNEPCDAYTATYDGDVKAIINNSCAIDACHSGAAGDSTLIALTSIDFTNYEGMKGAIGDGLITTRVLTEMDMPPGTVFLTPEQLEIMTCWKDAGFPEK